MDNLDKLVEKAIKTLNENSGFNEIELSDGSMRVHLVRFTPTPWYAAPWVPTGYSWQYKQP